MPRSPITNPTSFPLPQGLHLYTCCHRRQMKRFSDFWEPRDQRVNVFEQGGSTKSSWFLSRTIWIKQCRGQIGHRWVSISGHPVNTHWHLHRVWHLRYSPVTRRYSVEDERKIGDKKRKRPRSRGRWEWGGCTLWVVAHLDSHRGLGPSGLRVCKRVCVCVRVLPGLWAPVTCISGG